MKAMTVMMATMTVKDNESVLSIDQLLRARLSQIRNYSYNLQTFRL